MWRRLSPLVAVVAAVSVAQPAGAQDDRFGARQLALQLHPALAGHVRAVAVVDFVTPNGGTSELGRVVAEHLSVGLLETKPPFRVVDRAHLAALFREHELGGAGLVDPITMSRLGRLIGVDTVITGTLVPVAGGLGVSAVALLVETGEMIGAARVEIRLSDEVADLFARPGPGSHDSPPDAPPAGSLRQQKFLFRPEGCSREDDTVHCRLTVQNQAADRVLWLSGTSRLFGATGRVYQPSRLAMADDVREVLLPFLADQTLVAKLLLPGVWVPLVLTFDEAPETARSLPLLRLHLMAGEEADAFPRQFSIEMRDVPLRQP